MEDLTPEELDRFLAVFHQQPKLIEFLLVQGLERLDSNADNDVTELRYQLETELFKKWRKGY